MEAAEPGLLVHVRAGLGHGQELLQTDCDAGREVGALRECAATYEKRRWSPGKLEPVADALWRASEGYLDVINALPDSTPAALGDDPHRLTGSEF